MAYGYPVVAYCPKCDKNVEVYMSGRWMGMFPVEMDDDNSGAHIEIDKDELECLENYFVCSECGELLFDTWHELEEELLGINHEEA